MNIDQLWTLLLACTVIHYAVLLLWFALFVFARAWMQRLHGRWFSLSPQAFDTVHYAGMGLYKLLIAVFGLVPLIALKLAN